MEPVTHLLTGACLSRACGFPAQARYATAACVIAAELPDADFVYRLGGPLVYFQHHRGWTHALWSLPLQAALVVGIFWVFHTTRRQWKRRRSRDQPAPTRWFLLGAMALAALLTHLLLDWTNNYGLRPFAPFNRHWYAAGLVFIAEPLLLLCLGGALLLPLLFSLVKREIGVRRTKFAGRGLALAALAFTLLLWGNRAMERADADLLVRAQELRGGPVQKLFFSPYPVDPDRWHASVVTPANKQVGLADVRSGQYESTSQQIFAPQPETPAMIAAKASWLGRVYLDWSFYPVVQETGSAAEVHPEMTLSSADAALRVVYFRDLRFLYNPLGSLGNNEAAQTALTAEAWVDGTGHVQRIYFDGERQRLSHESE